MTKLTSVAMLISVALSAPQAHAATSSAFDLVCQGKNGQQLHFRFDLQQKKWCFGECHSVWVIDNLDEGMIKLSIHSEDESDYWSININRYTSHFSAVHQGYGPQPADSGQCTVESFSGFPQKKF